MRATRGTMAENGETTQSLKRRTVRLVEGTKVHPRESFDEAVARLLQERTALQLIERKDPELVATARRQAVAA
jgi:hypothetical protein